MIEDMANMTHLNEASVLANLRDRYRKGYIYVSVRIICSTFLYDSLVNDNGHITINKQTEILSIFFLVNCDVSFWILIYYFWQSPIEMRPCIATVDLE